MAKFCGCDQLVTFPAQEWVSQAKWQLNEKSTNSVANHTPLLACQRKASGETGLPARAEETSRRNQPLTPRRITSKGCGSHSWEQLLLSTDQSGGWNVAANGLANGAGLEDSFALVQGFTLTMAEVGLHQSTDAKKQMLASGFHWQAQRVVGRALQPVKR